LKFELTADQIVKGADHEAAIEDELGLFCRSFTSICDVASELAAWHCCGPNVFSVNGPSSIFGLKDLPLNGPSGIFGLNVLPVNGCRRISAGIIQRIAGTRLARELSKTMIRR
jgi:hypothetical protein